LQTKPLVDDQRSAISVHRSMGNLWHGVQAIAQKGKKQSLSHLLQCPRSFVNDPGRKTKGKRVPREKVRRWPEGCEGWGHKRSNARASLISHFPSLRSP